MDIKFMEIDSLSWNTVATFHFRQNFYEFMNILDTKKPLSFHILETRRRLGEARRSRQTKPWHFISPKTPKEPKEDLESMQCIKHTSERHLFIIIESHDCSVQNLLVCCHLRNQKKQPKLLSQMDLLTAWPYQSTSGCCMVEGIAVLKDQKQVLLDSLVEERLGAQGNQRRGHPIHVGS